MKRLWYWLIDLYVKFRNWFIEPTDSAWGKIAKFFIVVAIITALMGAYCLMIAILAKLGLVDVSNKDAQSWPYSGFDW